MLIPQIVSKVDYLQMQGDIMDFYDLDITPDQIWYVDNLLNIGGFTMTVENGRYAFSQALSGFRLPIMYVWQPEYNSVCENTVFSGEVKMGNFNVIGGQGFGYERHNHIPYRIPHLGNVRIGKCVEIGSNTCIDRGVVGSTVIGDRVKIDNNVHIAHGVEIGNNCLIVAGSVIGGSVKIGENCFIGINASIKNKVKIGNNVTIGMGAVVLSDVPDGETVKGLWK